MREIKFRAWDSKNKEIIPIYLWVMPSLPPMKMDLVRFGATYKIDAEITDVMQFTGLHDKNGKECYHKDIVLRLDSLFIIEWHANLSGWFLKPIAGGWHGLDRGDMALMCEVIGNIYENPELLKG